MSYFLAKIIFPRVLSSHYGSQMPNTTMPVGTVHPKIEYTSFSLLPVGLFINLIVFGVTC